MKAVGVIENQYNDDRYNSERHQRIHSTSLFSDCGGYSRSLFFVFTWVGAKQGDWSVKGR